MIFIILALSMGIFNANAARTINRNVEDKINYETGADITLMAHWESDRVQVSSQSVQDALARGAPPPANNYTGGEPAQYSEPPFSPYTQLEGVDSATKVFRQNGVNGQQG